MRGIKMIMCSFKAAYFSNGENYPSPKTFSICLNQVGVPFETECLFLLLLSSFDKLAQGAVRFVLKLSFESTDIKGSLTTLVKFSNIYKSYHFVFISKNVARSYQLIRTKFNNISLKTAADESLYTGSTIYHLHPFNLFLMRKKKSISFPNLFW
jgi:hypothetical protein